MSKLRRNPGWWRRLCLFALLSAQLSCGGLLSNNGAGTQGGRGGARHAPHFKPGFNLFTPEQDVELGRQSAQQIAQQVPLLRDERITNYVRQLGARLAAQAPGEKFPYQFSVVATRDINAFALPGGFIFVNAGTIAAAKNEGELAGVIAHEITHVALRHGTNQASKAYLAKAGVGILGGLVGSGSADLGQMVEAIGGAGANMVLLKFGRTAETQADLEGARIMADAGYDPQDMANFFKTLQAEGGQRVPEFLSDHPDPGNRFAAIHNVIPALNVKANVRRDSQEFQQTRALLTGTQMKRSAEPARIGRDPEQIEPSTRPQPPDSALKQYQSRDGSFAFQFPQNWDGLASGEDESNLIFAPKGAYGERDGSVYVTHGIFVGTVDTAGQSSLEQANAAFVEQQIKVNPDFRVAERPRRISFSGREGFATLVAGPSPVTGVTEVDVIYTTATADGRLFYLITICPEDEFQAYRPAFTQIIENLRLAR